MSCELEGLVQAQRSFTALMERARRDRIPLIGGIELTARCNLNCVHCYMHQSDAGGTLEPPQSSVPLPSTEQEMTTARVVRLIEEIAEAGCLLLLLTGGDPLLRRDFPVLYQHARKCGIHVIVFTNGTLLSEHIAALFREYPPYLVEVTLYGATALTYERITCIEGSYDRCVRGIRILRDAGVRVGLKTVLMTLNRHELEAMRALAEAWRCPFRFTGEIVPALNGRVAPLQYRLSPAAIAAHEMGDLGIREAWRRMLARQSTRTEAEQGRFYRCGAGLSGFYVTAMGKLVPCALVRRQEYDLLEGDFATGWRDAMPHLSERAIPEASPCRACGLREHCHWCPWKLGMESGAEGIPTTFHCDLLRWRLAHLIASVAR